MKGKMVVSRYFGVFLCVVLVLSCNYQALAAEFRADYVQNLQKEIKSGTIYVKDGQYRLELDDPVGPKMIMLVDLEINQTKILYPSYKIYQERHCDDRFCCLNDPIQSVKAMLKFYSLSSEGYDRVGGYICDKQLIHLNNERIMNRWMSEKLKFPLKIIALGSENTSTELRNIMEGAVDQALLTVPLEYKKTSPDVIRAKIANDPEIKVKLANYNKTKLQTSEITRVLTAGHEVRFFVAAGTQIKARALNGLRGGVYKWYAKTLQDGEGVNSGPTRFFEGPAEVDYKNVGQSNAIVFGAKEGEVYMSLELTGNLPLVLATSEEFYLGRGMKRSWPVNSSYQKLIVNIMGEKVLGNVPSMTRGKIIVARKISGQGSSKEAYDFVVQEGEMQTLEFTAAHGVNNFDLAILEGKVKVNLLVDNRETEEAAASLVSLDWRDLLTH